jgi:hypothetical protein
MKVGIIINYFYGTTAPSGPGGPIIEALRSHSDTPQWVGLLWTSDQPEADAST